MEREEHRKPVPGGRIYAVALFPVNQYTDTPYLALLAMSLLVSIASAGVFCTWHGARGKS